MSVDIFKTINMKAGDSQKSYQWYRTQISKLGNAVQGARLLQNQTLTTNIMPGSMYLFSYDPKHKETLPYYDILPLVLPFRKVPDGFYGINLHYLPYLARFKLLGELSKLATDKNMNEKTKIQISWEILNGSSKFLSATACVKHYLNNHIRSSFLKIPFTDWITASMLPVENFKKSTKEKVWRETVKKYS